MSNDELTSRRLPAEWETAGAVMIAWPHADTDWQDMLPEVEECYVRLSEAIVDDQFLLVVTPDLQPAVDALRHLPQNRIAYLVTPTNDTWTRDYGPITIVDEQGATLLLDFKFNAWGLKFAADKDNLVNRNLFTSGLADCDWENHLGFVLEGGSIESDGKGTLLTTTSCLLSPNRNGNMARYGIEKYLRRALGVNRFLWLDHGKIMGDDTDSHIDTLARFAPNDTIIYTKCYHPSDPHFEELNQMEAELMRFLTPDSLPYNLIALPLPDPIYDDEGNRLPATYANFLITPTSILLPTYDQPRNDILAAQTLKVAFPERRIKMVDCRALIRQHGSLHCATMQIPKSILKFLK